MDDHRHIVERVFVYAHSHKIIVHQPGGKLNGLPVTPELLIERAGMGILKRLKQVWEDPRLELVKEALVTTALTLDRDEFLAFVSKKQADGEKIRLPFIIVAKANGLADVEMRDLTQEQVDKFLQKMKHVGEQKFTLESFAEASKAA